MPAPYDDPRRITNAELKRDLQRIEGRIQQHNDLIKQIEALMPDLAKLSSNTDMLLHLAKEAEDDEIAWSVLRKWLRWDKGTRTFIKAVIGAIVVAVCTIIIYHLFALSIPGTETPPHATPTPTPIATPLTTPINVPIVK